ncbi:cytochrome b/b6 domain-containing protein [Streptomyces sp. NPDC057689]|uniref:cytochrome b/b6 domain-containing protein n=1 Tax=Streptomyces sp. NPDC057689 TaxID=3346213 RepID=UPI003690892F
MTSTPGSAGPTAATTPPPSEPAERVHRFARPVRLVHRATAALMLLCVASAACLYVPQLAELVGRRHLVVTVHEWSGLLIPVPLLAGLAAQSLRADLRRLNRFGAHDRRWLRAALRRDRRPGARPAGKFNAGQKLYAAWIAGAVLVMAGTGLLMWFTGFAPLVWRTAATFVHDWLALAAGLVLAGHIAMAYADPEARRGMRSGSVGREWARREHPLWEPAGRDRLDDQ